MKTKRFTPIFIALFIVSAALSAQTTAGEPVLISGTRFTYPLIEKWITEYTKLNTETRLELVQKTDAVADLNIVAHRPTATDLKDNQEIVYAGRYALLPVTNSLNPLLTSSKQKDFNKKEIDKLFFEVTDYDEEPVTEKPRFAATIYARDNQASASTTLAEYFGHITSEIKGKKVLGEDIYLLTAVKRDSIGIAFNNLGYLFDIQSRQLKEGITILPLDLKKESKNLLSGNLDEVIAILEQNRIETIPVEKLGFIYSHANARKEVTDFLKWVLTDGQKFNHEKGFLFLDKQELAEQTNRLTEKYLTSK